MHVPCLPPHMEGEEVKLLKITTFNVENIESNKQFVDKLLRSSDILCLQETWLFNFQLRQLGEMHKSLDGFGEAVNDDNPRPLPQYRSHAGMVEWRLYSDRIWTWKSGNVGMVGVVSLLQKLSWIRFSASSACICLVGMVERRMTLMLSCLNYRKY